MLQEAPYGLAIRFENFKFIPPGIIRERVGIGRWKQTNVPKPGFLFDLSNDINEDTISQRLATAELPDPDLCIRTAGETRVSNFLLWQFAYAEFWFTEVLWPDFDETVLDLALADYAVRERRFGVRSLLHRY